MKYLKIVVFVLLIIGLTVGIAVGVYGAFYFHTRNQEAKNQDKIYQATIEIPENACPVAGQTSSRDFFATVTTSKFEKVRQSFEAAVETRQGSVTSRSEYQNPPYQYDTAPQPLDLGSKNAPELYPYPGGSGSNYIYLSGTVPADQADAFINDIKKLVVSPDKFDSFSVTSRDGEDFGLGCDSALDQLRSLRKQEEILLLTLQKTKNSGDLDSITKSLTQIRQEAQSYKYTLQDSQKRLNKLTFSLTLQEKK